MTASAENPPNETKEKLADNNENTKWLTFATTGWAAYKMATPVAVSSYSLVSANDFPGRDPKNWTLQGSADGSTWVDLDTRTNEIFQERFQTRTFTFANTTVYPNYRLNITANSGEPLIQLADLKLFKDTSTTPPPPEPAPQQAVLDVLDAQHPATAGLPQNWTRTDRWLNWETNPVGTVHTVAQVEEKGYNPASARTARSTRSPGAATTTAAAPSTPAWAAPRGPTAKTSSASTCSAPCAGRPAWCAATARPGSPRTTRSSG